MSRFNAKSFNDVALKSFNDAAIVYVKGSAYRIHFLYMSKDDAISILSNSNLIDKALYNVFIIYKKWVNATLIKKLIIKKAEMWY